MILRFFCSQKIKFKLFKKRILLMERGSKWGSKNRPFRGGWFILSLQEFSPM